MNDSESALQRGARPKARPSTSSVVVNGSVEPSCSDNNNSRRSQCCDETMANDRLTPRENQEEQFSRPCDTAAEGSRTSSDADSRWIPHDNSGEGSSSSQPSTSHGQLKRPSELAVNGYSADVASTSQANEICESDESEFSVLPRQLLQANSDYCGLNGDCDLCGGKNVEKLSINGRYETEEFDDNKSVNDEEEEGAVGEDALFEVLPDRCSPDSGEGEFENQNSRSPSWDQQSSTSEEECFYRYRGEDDQRNPAINEHIPNRVENDARRRSSSPEMDYLEMDFDPSSSDWGGDDSRPSVPSVSDQLLPEPGPPPTPPLPQVNQPSTSHDHSRLNIERVPSEHDRPSTSSASSASVVAIETRGDLMLWSQSRAAELAYPFTTPLTSASNAIFYTMSALGHSVTRESIVAHLNELHPSQSVPQTLVNYLIYRGSHTSPATPTFFQASYIITGSDLGRALRVFSRGQLRARFFPILSRELLQSGNLCTYIKVWLHRGFVPILTFSQAHLEGSRHEMVFGSSDGGLHLMGEPYRVMTESSLSTRLSGLGRVSVPHSELLARWNCEQDLRQLVQSSSLAWATNNVLGSVVGMLREATLGAASPSPSSPCTSRQPQPQPTLRLPLLCESGVTLVCDTNNPNCHLMDNCRTISQ